MAPIAKHPEHAELAKPATPPPIPPAAKCCCLHFLQLRVEKSVWQVRKLEWQTEEKRQKEVQERKLVRAEVQ